MSRIMLVNFQGTLKRHVAQDLAYWAVLNFFSGPGRFFFDFERYIGWAECFEPAFAEAFP